MLSDIDSNAAVIDSREVVARYDDLSFEVVNDSITREEVRELDSLGALISKCEAIASNWGYGAVLVRYDHFTVYIKKEFSEVYKHILWDLPAILADSFDWLKVAELAMTDYAEIDYDGVTYYLYRTKY